VLKAVCDIEGIGKSGDALHARERSRCCAFDGWPMPWPDRHSIGTARNATGAAPNESSREPRLGVFQPPGPRHAFKPPSPVAGLHRAERTLNERIGAQPDAVSLARDIHVRQGVGATAHVLQGSGLEILRARVEQPALILVDRGIKAVRAERGASVRALPGQAIVIGGNQTVDFTNSVPDGTHYEARWLLFDLALLDDPHYLGRSAQATPASQNSAPVRLLSQVQPHLVNAFENARQALAPQAGIPDSVVRQRLLEVMHWLLEAGVVLRSAPVTPSVSVKVRALIAGRLECAWTAARVAGELALSEATLRRRLAAEGASLTQLLTDARMSTALTLLQATARPVSDIARAVGYESPSRFAVRFRQRFGFAPTAVRGHERP